MAAAATYLQVRLHVFPDRTAVQTHDIFARFFLELSLAQASASAYIWRWFLHLPYEPRIAGTTRWMFALNAICCCWSQKLRLNSLPGPSHSHRSRRSSLTATATRQASQGCRPVAPRGPASPLSESSKGWPRCEAWLSRPSGRK